jgi:Ca2+-binding EF-hand superfamily protein
MFSSSPSQQIMVENLRKAQRSGLSVKEVLKKENSVKLSTAGGNKEADIHKGLSIETHPERSKSAAIPPAPLVRKLSSRAARNANRSGKVLKVNAESIEEDLERQDTHGTAIRKIAEAMAGFSVERDGVMLDAFRTRMLEYSNFRMLLKRSLSLTFSDAEFDYVCGMFDRDGDKTVDGEEFLVVCKLLAHAWRKRGLKKNKERDKYLESVLKEKEDTELAERQAYLENAADFVFSKDDEDSMLKKMKKAASKVNKLEPGAPPLHGFEPMYLKPKEALVAIRNAFRVPLTPKELGSLIRMFDFEKRGLLDTTTFMVQFSRWGIEYRDAHRTMQIEKSRKAAQDLIDRHNNLMQSKDQQRESVIDMTFTDADKESALAKLRVAAKGYRKHSASSVPLDGFSSTTITPGMFREMVKRTFNVIFTGKELGVIVNMFDEDGVFEISCKAFLVFFTRMGIEERFKDHTAQLEESRAKYSALQGHHENKIKALHDKNLISHELLIRVKPEDTESADRKLRFAARHYSMTTCGMPGALDVFNVDKMTPGIFQEKLQKFLSVFLTPIELAALLIQFDTEGDRIYIDCIAFTKFFKRLGFNEKEKLWEEERIRRNTVIEAAVQHKRILKEKFVAMVENGAADYNFTKEDADNAMRKLEVGASQYDATNPQAVGLTAFESAYITPGQLKEKLNRTFNVDLTPKELGSIVQSRLDEDGKASCESMLKLIKDLAKAKKERLRRRRLETELAEIAEAKERDRKRAESKLHADAERLRHEEEDVRTLMRKLNGAAQAFAVDKYACIYGLICVIANR